MFSKLLHLPVVAWRAVTQPLWERRIVRADHLIEIAKGFARVKEEAIASSRWSDGVAAVRTSRGLLITYAVERDGSAFKHRISVAGVGRSPGRLVARDLLGWLHELLPDIGAMTLGVNDTGQGFELELDMSEFSHRRVSNGTVRVPEVEGLPERLERARAKARGLAFGELAEPGYL